MNNNNLKHLKSGTDIRGCAVDGIANEPCELTDEAVGKISYAFAKWLKDKTGKQALRVSVGHDSRISAQRIKAAVIGALTDSGVLVYDFGYSSTPSMFMSTIEDLKCDAAVEITASHHPYQKNGLKFFTAEGGLEGSDISEILELAENEVRIDTADKGACTPYNFMDVYSALLRDVICRGVNAENYDKPLESLKIIVDAGNGVGGFYAEKVLAPLGADCTGSQFLDPDGMFPNHVPNPENQQAIDSICAATVAAKADLGIIFDTDVDRMGCVDNFGNEINRNRLIALASVIALENAPGGTIVTDSVTSDGLRDFIEGRLGAKQLRFKRGYKNVINKSIELCNCGIDSPLAIETSGHAALKENYFLDDGAYLATKIVVKLAQLKKENKTLNDLISSLKEPAESFEIRAKIQMEDFKEYGLSVLGALKEFADNKDGWEVVKENYEGVRINFHGGWLLLRLSVHDPILPLNVECDHAGGSLAEIREVYKFLSSFEHLELDGFRKYL